MVNRNSAGARKRGPSFLIRWIARISAPCITAWCVIACDAAGPTDAPTDAGMVVVPLRGCAPFYTADVELGGSQTFALAVDTGSTTVAVASSGCTSCSSAGVPTLYEPGPNATDQGMSTTAVYGDGELSWSGEIYKDTVQIGGLPSAMRFGAIRTQMYAVGQQQCDAASGPEPTTVDGFFGLGADSLLIPGTDSYFDIQTADGTLSDAFAVQLCHLGGTLWLGGYDPQTTTAPMQYTPLTETGGFHVERTDAHVGAPGGDIDVPVPLGELAFVDSGGPSMIVPDVMFTSLAAAIEQNVSFSQLFGASWLQVNPSSSQGNCVALDMTPSEVDAVLAPITLRLGVANPISVELAPTQSYLSWHYNPPSTQILYCQNLYDSTVLGPGAQKFVDLGELDARPRASLRSWQPALWNRSCEGVRG